MNENTQFKYTCPVLASENVTRDVEWYESKLGFENVYDSSHYHDGPLDYAVLRRGNAIFHLQFQYLKDMTSSDIKFDVMGIDEILQNCIELGLLTKEKFNAKTPWGTAEFGLKDPSGNRLTFFEDLLP